jgi:hypothetical protein
VRSHHARRSHARIGPSLLVSFDDLGRRRDDFTDVSTCVTGESGSAQRRELERFIFEDEFHDLRPFSHV